MGTWVERARQEVAERVDLPAGYTIFWSGQYEYMERARQRLLVIVPITLLLIVLILYVNTRSWAKTAIVLLAVPFSLVGAIWLMYFLGYNVSVAVAVGFSFGNASALYVTALIANICQAGFIFVRFVASAFSHQSEILPD